MIVLFGIWCCRGRGLVLPFKYLALDNGTLFLNIMLLCWLNLLRRTVSGFRIIEALGFRVQSSFFRGWSPLQWADSATICNIYDFSICLPRTRDPWINRTAASWSLFSNYGEVISIIKRVLKDLKGLLWSQAGSVYLLHFLPYFFDWKTNKIFSGPLNAIVGYLLHWAETWGWDHTLLVKNIKALTTTAPPRGLCF